MSRLRQCHRQVRRHRRFTYSALTAVNSYYMLCMYWRFEIGNWRLDILLDELGVDMRDDIRVDIGAQRHFRSLDYGFKEGIIILREDK